MTAFDVVALAVFAVSALVGYVRGAVREVVMFTALALAAVVAIFALPFSAGALRHVVHPRWIAAAAAVIVVFVIVYVGVRMLGATATTRLHQSSLGTVDRGCGAGVGVVRALVLLGLASIVLESAPWPNGAPSWLEHAATYPIARGSGRVLAKLAPAGGSAFGGLGRFMGDGIVKGFAPSDDATPTSADPEANAQSAGDSTADSGDNGRTLKVRTSPTERRRRARSSQTTRRHSVDDPVERAQ